MHQEKITVLFVINSSRINQKGLCAINCRITINRERKQFATGLFINRSYWVSQHQKVNTRQANHGYINAQIERIKVKIYNIALVFQLQGIAYSLDDIYNEYRGVEIKKKEGISSYYNQYLLRIKKLVGLDIKQNTYNKFVYVGKDLEAFIKWQYKKSDVSLEGLNLQFLEDFDYFLKTEKRQKQITINKEIQRLTAPIKRAISEGFIDRDPFILYKSKAIRKEVVFLSPEELKLLEESVLIPKRLSMIQDLFIYLLLLYRVSL
ncbi:MAG: integrase/recombinase XerD [Flavobacteriales bacterium]|jgi:integrase/recombinase XerD